jgi:CxxC motif-containing protein (DUF1111 family)
MKRRTLTFAAIAFAILTVALALAQQPGLPGSPMAGLNSQEFELFRVGREDFMEVETPEEGLGPMFNGTSCAQCHNIPAVGGTGTMVETRAGYRDENGRFHEPPGGTVMHLFSVPPHDCQISIYEEANVVAHRISIPLFGVGLVEAIPDETILALADPEDKNGDGIRGRAAIVKDVASGKSRVGRFGWKAQHATLLAFAADAYLNEMGITNDLFATEAFSNVSEEKLSSTCRSVQKIEDIRDRRTGRRGIDNFESFLKFLAPPARGPLTPAAARGESLFNETGCALCHVPQLMTGQNPNPLFDRKPVPLFSDLLLHDIGTGDDIEQEDAKGNEIRTPALWGLRFRRPLLHDGSAPTIEKAIERHKGEASSQSKTFSEMLQTDREDLLSFLKSL